MHSLLRAMTCTFRHAETSLGLPVIARPTGVPIRTGRCAVTCQLVGTVQWFSCRPLNQLTTY